MDTVIVSHTVTTALTYRLILSCIAVYRPTGDVTTLCRGFAITSRQFIVLASRFTVVH